ncbi:MAG: neuraminidase-like domain-containing protein [Acidimicrobiales bacterium]
MGRKPVGAGGAFSLTIQPPDQTQGELVVVVVELASSRSGPQVALTWAGRTQVELTPPPRELSYSELREALYSELLNSNYLPAAVEPSDRDATVDELMPGLSDEDLTDIAGAIIIERSQLEHLRAAAAADLFDVPTAVSFVLAAAGIALDLDVRLDASTEDAVRDAISGAISAGTIAATDIGSSAATATKAAEDTVSLLNRAASLQILDSPVEAGGSTMAELLDILYSPPPQGAKRFTDANRLTLAGVMTEQRRTDANLVEGLTTARWRTAAERQALHHVLWLDQITLSSLPLVADLNTQAEPLPPRTKPDELIRRWTVTALGWSLADWTDLIKGAGPESIPERFRDDSVGIDTQRATYATAMIIALRHGNPEAAARKLVNQATERSAIIPDRDNPVDDLYALASANDDFEVLTGPIPSDRPGAATERRLVRRAVNSSEADAVEFLFTLDDENAPPPQALARMGQRAFGGNEDTYREAAFANAALLTVFADLRATSVAARAEDRKGFPSWSQEFGRLDDTDCEHCSSVYSQSAYLVDLLRFVGDRRQGEQLLAETRRPDLESIKLNCANTETVVPYIDLVNEVLEAAVIGAAIEDRFTTEDGTPITRPLVGQTTVTDPAELRAHPEHLAADAYTVVRDTVYPFSIPFDLWEAEARAYLALVGVDRSEVRLVVSGANEKTAADRLGLFPSDLPILDGKAKVENPSFDTRAYKNTAEALVEATGLGADELSIVVSTAYVADGAVLAIDLDDGTVSGPFKIAHARRIHRLLLLRRRLGLSFEQLDRLLGVVNGIGAQGELRSESVSDLAALHRLAEALSTPLETVVSMFEPTLRTERDDAGRSDYDDWFGKPTGTEKQPEVFALNGDRSALATATALVSDNDVELRTALMLSIEDFAFLQSKVDESLTLDTMADLARWTTLSRVLGLTVSDLGVLTRVSDLEPFVEADGQFDIEATERFIDAARSVAAAGLTPRQVEAILLNPVTEAEVASPDSAASKLAATIASALTGAKPDDDRNALLIDTVAKSLDIDPDAAGSLLVTATVNLGGQRRPVGEVLIDPAAEPTSREVVIAADRLGIAAALIRALALPAAAADLVFEPATQWLDPNIVPLSLADLSTEQLRSTVVVTAPPVVRAEADGTAEIAVAVEVDGASADPAQVSWHTIGDAVADLRPTTDGWSASISQPGEITLVATVATDVEGHAPGIGAVSVNLRSQEDWPIRTSDGLLALYQFHEGSGTTVTDVSGIDDPLDLTIDGDVSWIPDGGLAVTGKTLISSPGPASKIINAVKPDEAAGSENGEITVEAWVTPARTDQWGPARLVTISDGVNHRNVTLAQEGTTAVGRFRHDRGDLNGTTPTALTPGGQVGTELVHLVLTRNSEKSRLYVNGVEQASDSQLNGATTGWDDDMHLALAGELNSSPGNERSWNGIYHLVAIYGDALTEAQVAEHHAAGPRPAIDSPEVTATPGPSVMLAWDAETVALDVDSQVAAERPDLLKIEWTTISGPAPVAFADPMELSTTATFATTGEYVVGLRAFDQRDLGGWAQAAVTVRIAADPDGVPARWERFTRALEFASAAYATDPKAADSQAATTIESDDSSENGDPPLFAVLATAVHDVPEERLSRAFIDELGKAVGIGPRVDTLLDDPRLGGSTYGEFHDGSRLIAVARAGALARRVGANPAKLLAWADDTIDRHEASEIKTTVRSTFERKHWLETAADLRDELRERQRDALVDYLLVKGASQLAVHSRDDLYGHFLIDTEMSSCQLTTRLAQAVYSVQQFVQRTLLGIEEVAVLDTDAAEQWRWMKSYRLWEANRKVFLHPENWLEPELRNDKSPFFEDLERDLAQTDLTDSAAERAFARYLEQLDSVASLEIVGICQEHDGSRPTTPEVVHLIGRTTSSPKHYWHRTLTAGIEWSPWRRIEVDISGDHVVPVFHNRRLRIFWAEFEPKDEAPDDPKDDDAKARRFTSCSLSMTELRDGQWTPKVLSDGAARYMPTTIAGEDLEIPTDPDSGDLDFSRFSFDVRFDGTTSDLVLAVSYRDGGTMLRWPGFELSDSGRGLRPRPGLPQRLSVERPTTHDRFQSFGFGSSTATSLYVSYRRGELNNQLPTLTEDNARAVTYRINASGPPLLQVARTIADSIVSLFSGKDRSVRSAVVAEAFTEATRDSTVKALEAISFRVAVTTKAGRAPTIPHELLDGVTPPWKAVATRRTDLSFDRLPFVFQDKLAGFLVVAAKDDGNGARAELRLLSNPLVGEFRRALDQSGVAGLLAAPSGPLRHQALQLPIGDRGDYQTKAVAGRAEAAIDFGVAGSFSSYHWELFFHVPFLIAKLLTRNQRFGEAQRWLHFIFNPTAASRDGDTRGESWQIKPLRQEAIAEAAEDLGVLLKGGDSRAVRDRVEYLLGEIQDNPFDPHVVARLRTSSYKKAVVMAYLDNLIAWADQLFSQDTLETVNEAAQLYVMAADILGDRPVRKPADDPVDFSAAELEQRGLPEELRKLLGEIPSPQTNMNKPRSAEEPPAITLELTFCVPANPKLLGYWDVITDRLYKVRHCQNIDGIERALALFGAPIDPGALVRAAAAGTGGAATITGAAAKVPHHRFRLLHWRARAAANQVRLLGGTLLNALESRDDTALRELMSTQEVSLQRGTRSFLALEKKEAEQVVEGLQEAQKAAVAAKEFVDGRPDETSLEAAAFGLETAGLVVKTVSGVMSQIAGAVGLGPEAIVGAAGISSPVVLVEYGGSKVAGAIDSIADGLGTVGDVLDGSAGLVANRAELERRKAVFAEEKKQAAIAVAQVNKELAAAETAVGIAIDNINTLEMVISHVEAIHEHHRARFTDAQMWNSLVDRASEIYFHAYSIALDLARRAEAACRLELGDDDISFISANNWDSLRKGLLSGEGLMLDLTTMEAAYFDQARREHELTLPIRLSELGGVDPLRRDGVIEMKIPESALDRRTPGHYMRRIKSVAVTVEGPNGPLAIPAKLTLLRGSTRVRPDVSSGYQRTGPEDQRFSDDVVPTSIVTSGRPGDTGMFVRNYDDDRYLPFEAVGLADSRWRLDLFGETGVNLTQVRDVELIIDYTARDGGTQLRNAAAKP